VTGALHADALEVLVGWCAPDPAQEQLRREFVDHLRRHPDGMLRSCWPDHVTASTGVLSSDHTAALLTLHAKARSWFQMGGHCEESDTSLAAAAQREAAEESGVPDLRLDPVPVHLDAHDVPFCGAHPGVRHLDVEFLAVAPAGAEHAVSEESLEVRWWPVDAPPNPDLVELLRRAVDRARSVAARFPDESATD